MTDEVQPAEVPDSGLAAPETPETEPVDTGTTPDVAEDSDTPETPDKPKGGFQRRIAELVEQRNEERRAREATERRLDQLVEMMMAKQEPQAPAQPSEPPTLESSGFDEAKYQQSLLEYARNEARREAQEAFKAERAREQVESRHQSFKAREQEFAKSTPDYQSVVYDRNVPISETMAEVIAESDVGPQLAYHLARNRTVAESIYKLPPVAAARELGRIEAQLNQPKPAPVRTTQAPPPPPKVEATEPEIARDPEKMSMADFIKWRERQIKARRK